MKRSDQPSLMPQTNHWGDLPASMRALLITSPLRPGAWLAEAFAADSAAEVEVQEAHGMAAGAALLRDEQFDAVLIDHDPDELDALELLDVVRTGSCDRQPIIVMGQAAEGEMTALCYEAGADAYACLRTTTTRSLIWLVARAIERHRLLDENQRLLQLHQSHLRLEHEESSRLLQQQRALISDLQRLPLHDPSLLGEGERGEHPSTAGSPSPAQQQSPQPSDSADETSKHPPTPGDLRALAASVASVSSPSSDTTVATDIPTTTDEQQECVAQRPQAGSPLPPADALVQHYRELLRAYVIMGSGHLTSEMHSLVDQLRQAELSTAEVMALHLQAVEPMIDRLGNRSARHVWNRADLLILEVMMHLCDGYHRTAQQVDLPTDGPSPQLNSRQLSLS